MSRVNEILSANFRMIREQRKLSLDGAAKLTGVSKSMLAQIERGEVSPTVAILWKIADGLKIPFTRLLQNPQLDIELVPAEKLEPLLADAGRYRNFPLFPCADDRRFEIYAIELDPGCDMRAEGHPAGTEEFVAVVDGVLSLSVGGETRDIGRGGAVRFAADRTHGYANRGDSLCRLSMVIFYRQTP